MNKIPLCKMHMFSLSIRQLMDTVRVVSAERIVVYLQDGTEITQDITG